MKVSPGVRGYDELIVKKEANPTLQEGNRVTEGVSCLLFKKVY